MQRHEDERRDNRRRPEAERPAEQRQQRSAHHQLFRHGDEAEQHRKACQPEGPFQTVEVEPPKLDTPETDEHQHDRGQQAEAKAGADPEAPADAFEAEPGVPRVQPSSRADDRGGEQGAKEGRGLKHRCDRCIGPHSRDRLTTVRQGHHLQAQGEHREIRKERHEQQPEEDESQRPAHRGDARTEALHRVQRRVVRKDRNVVHGVLVVEARSHRLADVNTKSTSHRRRLSRSPSFLRRGKGCGAHTMGGRQDREDR